jgi:hypothetical protein
LDSSPSIHHLCIPFLWMYGTCIDVFACISLSCIRQLAAACLLSQRITGYPIRDVQSFFHHGFETYFLQCISLCIMLLRSNPIQGSVNKKPLGSKSHGSIGSRLCKTFRLYNALREDR